MKIHDAAILITGASQGIGRHLALALAQRGARIVAAARNVANLAETRRRIEEAGAGSCACVPMDLADASSVERAAGIALQAGGIDILINNAADVTSKPLLETAPDEIARLVATNVTGPLQLARLVAPSMLERGRGMIVNISSLAGYKPNPAQTVYSVTKTAVNGMSDALRAELGGRGIRVMNVALASVCVEGTPRPGQVPAEQFAHRLAAAIERDETELFLSPVTKWLMRLYRFYPPLMRMR